MKKLLLAISFLFVFSVCSKSQTVTSAKDTIKVIFENDKMIVTEYVSTPGNDVCGLGRHSHNPHLTIMLTDASVKLMKDNEKPQLIDLKAGDAFWSGADTHMVVNTGTKPIRLYIVEPK
jgi:PBP1b-binding outer membrane lipoprotein LpoB